MSTLSIIVPIYNKQAYLESCIISILKQRYMDFELILIDDGSVDESARICDLYSEKDARVIVIHQENQGVIKARLNGVLKSKSPYVTFVDADDWISSDMYIDLMGIMENEHVDMVTSGICRYHNETKKITATSLLREGRYTRQDIEKEIIPYMLWSTKRNTWELDPSLCTKIFEKESIIKHLINIQDLGIHYGDDTSVIYPLMLELKSMYVSHKTYYFHRQRELGEVPLYFTDKLFFEKTFATYRYLRDRFETSEFADVLSKQLDYFYINSIQYKKKNYLEIAECQENVFPFKDIHKGAKVILYGAGEVGCSYMEQNEQFEFCDIIMWVDKNYEKLRLQGKRIDNVKCIEGLEFDYIVIAIKSAELAKEIKQELMNLGVVEAKIVWNGSVIQRIN